MVIMAVVITFVRIHLVHSPVPAGTDSSKSTLLIVKVCDVFITA